MKIGFIGMGNMAKAMVGGMLKKGIAKPQEIVGSAKSEKSRQSAEEAFGITMYAENVKVAEEADV